MRTSLILLVGAFALLTAASAAGDERSPWAQLYADAGLAEVEQARIEEMWSSWSAKPGSTAAAFCAAPLASTGGDVEPCASMAEGDGDAIGQGLLLTLGACSRIGRGDAAGAATTFRRALQVLDPELAADDVLRVMLHSSLGVALATGGDPEAGVDEGRVAIELATRVLGEQHEYVAQNQLMVSWYLFNLGRAAEAVVACGPALRDPDAEWLADLPGLVCFNHMAAGRFGAGDLPGAESLWGRSLVITESLYGPGSAETTTIVGNLGNSALQQGRFVEARDRFLRADAAARATWPEGSLEHTTYAPWLAHAHVGLGELDEAATLYLETLQAWEHHYGPESPTAAMGLQSLAGVYQKQGRYDEARALLVRAVRIGGLAGARSVEHGSALGAIAELHRETGRHREAARAYALAVSIFEEAYGPDHVEVAALVLNEANLQRDMGDHATAKERYERALRIYEAAHGPDHPFVATVLSNLAGLRLDLGDLEGALPLLERSVATYERTVGPEHEWVASGLNNMALVYEQLGDLQKAWDLLNRAVTIWEKTLGAEHPNSVAGRTNLATILASNGDLDQALAMYEAEVVTARQRLGPDHPTVATAVANLAGTLRLAGDLPGARSRYEEALSIRVRALGRDHPHVADTRARLARVHLESGAPDRARDLMAVAFAQITDQVVPLLDVTSERERIALIRSLRDDLDLFVTLFDRPEDSADVHRAVLAWKAVVKNSLVEQRDALLTAREPELADRLTELSEVRRALATAVFAEPGDPAEHQREIGALTGRKEELERELARRSRGFQERRRLDGTSSSEVCRTLAGDEAVVDLLRYTRANPSFDAEDQERYVALVLTGGSCHRPTRVELGEANAIDQAVARYRRKIPQLGFGSRLQQQAQGLRELLWDPIEPALGGRTRIWLVPDGGLTGLPFGALVDPDGGYLVERLSIGYLASANDLLRSPSEGGSGALVVGGVDYDGGAAAQGDGVALASTRSAPRGALEDFAYLPGTAAEAADVVARLAGETVYLSGSEATEGRIRQAAPGRRLIHLATHGFFATGAVRSALAGGVVEGERTGAMAGAGDGLNPMLLSGVVLAGANSPDGDGYDDGVLTAEEVVGLDLRGAELVTLSACETGLGEVARGEGVMGLRRAFALAGARSLVFSLWQVPDAETRRLMTAFYDRIAAAPGEPLSESFRASQLQLIQELRAERGDAPPLFWAAFVVSGR